MHGLMSTPHLLLAPVNTDLCSDISKCLKLVDDVKLLGLLSKYNRR